MVVASAADKLDAGFIALLLATAEDVDEGVDVDERTLVVTTAQDASNKVDINEVRTLKVVDVLAANESVTLAKLETSTKVEEVTDLETDTGIQE